jgi:hypothetical protein
VNSCFHVASLMDMYSRFLFNPAAILWARPFSIFHSFANNDFMIMFVRTHTADLKYPVECAIKKKLSLLHDQF